MPALLHLCINQHTTFEVPSLTDSKDMTGAKLKKNESRDFYHTDWGLDCHPKASI